MPGTGGLTQVVALLSRTSEQNTRLGRAFVLFGAFAFVGGGLVFSLTGTLQLTAEDQWAYRLGAGTLVGGALPAILHGLVLLADTTRPPYNNSDIGMLVCTLAAGILLSTAIEAPRYAGPALLIYGSGVLLCVSAVSSALSAKDNTTASDDRLGTAADELTIPDDEPTVLLKDPPAN